jgi:hypothetical protein
MDDDHHLVVDPTAVKQLQDDLYQRMQLMLPVAAAVMTADPPKQGRTVEPSPSACLVSCPAAMLHVALKWNPTVSRRPIQGLEGRRYPLHYAATRIGYSAHTHWRLSGNSNPPEASPATFYPFSQRSVAPQMRKSSCRCTLPRRDGIAPQHNLRRRRR